MKKIQELKIAKLQNCLPKTTGIADRIAINSRFVSLFKEVGNLLPQLSVRPQTIQTSTKAREEALASTMKQLMLTCLDCNLSLTSIFGGSIGRKPEESYNLVLADIESAVEKWKKLNPTDPELVAFGLELIEKIGQLYTYVKPSVPLGSFHPKYFQDRQTAFSIKAMSQLLAIISNTGSSVVTVVGKTLPQQ